MTIAHFSLGPSDEFDEYAVSFVKSVRWQLQNISSSPPAGPIPAGPHFDYALGPDLFSNRRGAGPLVVAWDTNIVIDYLTYGDQLWELRTEPDEFADAEPEHLVDLQLLRIVLAVWVMRTVEFVILRGSITDARKALSDERRNQRARLHLNFDEAIRLLVDPEDNPVVFPASPAAVDAAVAAVPQGADRQLVRAAWTRGAHVFLTRDRGILGARADLRQIGIVPLTPGELFDELCACGAVLASWFPENYATWPFPDLARVGMIIRSFAAARDHASGPSVSAPARWILGRLADAIDKPSESDGAGRPRDDPDQP